MRDWRREVADTLIDDVSDTAFWIAHYRGIENERPDALFHDPLAKRLAGDRGKKIAEAMPRGNFTSWAVVVRTCMIDDFIRFAIAQGVNTVLNLGAGLDTRPYRMNLPATLHWVEADYPHVIEFKEDRLRNETPRCRLTRVELDLANTDERRRMLDTYCTNASKVLILTEGVVPYLSETEAASLAEDLKPRAAYWIVDYLSAHVVKLRPRRIQEKMKNAPFKFMPDDWVGFFQQHGWRVKELRYLSEEAERLKRPLRFPLWMIVLGSARALFQTKAQREAFKSFYGYAILEPI
jgi:methyltransferase (TIGR00027 family)